jgi:hypothetical protein
MSMSLRRLAAAVLSVCFFIPLAVSAAGVQVLFDLHDRTKTLFPSNLFTVPDFSQNTFRRVNLKKPDCAVNIVRCWDIDVLNKLDGFNIQPRLSIPFSGPIDVSTVNSDSVFLVSLGSTTGRGSVGDKVGINQVVWDPASNTLFAESDELLEQHTRYAVVVTNRVRDAHGDPIEAKGFERFHRDGKGDRGGYREQLVEGLATGRRHGGERIVAASIFTTMSVTSTLEKIQEQIKASHPAPARFDVGSAGERAVFPVTSLASATWDRQTGTAPAFTTSFLPLPALFARPGVGALAFGSYVSPNYQAPGEFIPQTGTRTGTPAKQGSNTIHFILVVPGGARPASGWPVAIFGHGFTDSRFGAPFAVAASMAERGIATIAINVVGHGGGPRGTVTIRRVGGTPVTVPDGGRGIDQDGDGNIDSTEGSSAAVPNVLLGSADALRQTTVDLMQLVRQIQIGVDVDGDGLADLDPARIYYSGQSFGGIYGTIFLGVERDVRVGVPNVPGGPIIDIVRLSPVFRGLFVAAAAARGLSGGPLFNENLPLRNQLPLTNNVAGAIALQDLSEQSEWATQAGNPVAYAPYLRKAPLPGNPLKSVIIQYAKGDQTVPNPTATAIVRAGALQDRVTYYRNDVAFVVGGGVSKDPHTFLTNIGDPGIAPVVALKAQAQIATFFASNGALTIDPDDALPGFLPPGFPPLFETPIVLPLPETLNFIP